MKYDCTEPRYYECVTRWYYPIDLLSEEFPNPVVIAGDVVERTNHVWGDTYVYQTRGGVRFMLSKTSLDFHFRPLEEDNDAVQVH